MSIRAVEDGLMEEGGFSLATMGKEGASEAIPLTQHAIAPQLFCSLHLILIPP